ncbi:MAG: L-seryl-tRNA(Sec) selenium transferase [Longimicrobiales bacterium]
MSDDPRRAIPAVDRLLGSAAFDALRRARPVALVRRALQEVQDELRVALAAGAPMPAEIASADWYAERVRNRLTELERASLRRVVNATGVVLHTNLGRAQLAEVAVAAVAKIGAGYSNLEFDLERGERGSRYDHCRALLLELTGAEDALVVNNNAGAVLLALNTLADGREAIVSRGEQVEIGGAFRVPEIMERSGARMVEVGTTNRTHLADYANAITPATAALLKVHQSNFSVHGFTAAVAEAELVELARERGLEVIADLGSGLLLDLAPFGLPGEPTVARVVVTGVDIVTMSGDKLLGGPQAGIAVGGADAIGRMRRNPLCRTLRVDKLTLAALEATLVLYRDPPRALREIPTLRMLTIATEQLRERAERLAAQLRDRGIDADCAPGSSAVGGGAFPDAELPTTLVRVAVHGLSANALQERLRRGEAAVVTRIVDESVVLDPRTIEGADEEIVVLALANVRA